MPENTLAIIGLVIFGLVFGYLTSLSSNRRETIHGGIMAQGFNYLASCLWATITPTVLVSVIVLEVPFLQAIAVAIGMLAVAFLCTIGFAVFEKPALDRIEQSDRGWTAQDAISSGL